MKNFISTICILFISIAVWAGNDGGGGGDTYGNEFEALAKEIHKTMASNPNDPALKKWNLSPELFREAISMTILRSGERIYLNGEEVDAINKLSGENVESIDNDLINENVIKINRSRWRTLRLFSKLKIVLHEYLGILQIERNNYKASQDLTGLVRETYNRVRSNVSDQDIDLYYGYRRAAMPVNSSSICDSSTEVYKQAVAEATKEALSRCQSEHEKCSVKNTETEPFISTEYIGLKYCAVTVVTKRE